MADEPPRGPGPSRALHLVVRLALALALVVLLVLIGIREAPEVIAAVAPAASVETAPAGDPSADASREATAAAPATTTTVPTITVPSASTGGGGSGSRGGGTGTSGGAGSGSGTGSGGTRTTTEPSPAVVEAVITSMTSSGDVECLPPAEDAPGAVSPSSPDVTIRWRSTGGVGDAYFGVNTQDAQAAPYRTTHQSDSITLTFPCSERQQMYTVTVLSQDGSAVSRSLIVQNVGYVS